MSWGRKLFLRRRRKRRVTEEAGKKHNEGFVWHPCHPVTFHNLPKDPIFTKCPHRGHLIPRPECAMTPILWKTWNLLLSSLSISFEKQTSWAAFHLQRHLNKDAHVHRNRWQMFISSPGCSWAHPLSRLGNSGLAASCPAISQPSPASTPQPGQLQVFLKNRLWYPLLWEVSLSFHLASFIFISCKNDRNGFFKKVLYPIKYMEWVPFMGKGWAWHGTVAHC